MLVFSRVAPVRSAELHPCAYEIPLLSDTDKDTPSWLDTPSGWKPQTPPVSVNGSCKTSWQVRSVVVLDKIKERTGATTASEKIELMIPRDPVLFRCSRSMTVPKLETSPALPGQ